MKLINYTFLTDENINPIIVQSLRERGCDVFDVKEQGLQGNTDTFLLSLATEQNRVVLTHDSDTLAL